MDVIKQVLKERKYELVLLFSYGQDTIMSENLKAFTNFVFEKLNINIVNTASAIKADNLDKDRTIKELDFINLFTEVMKDLEDPYY